jgi:hypothetical protein
MMVEPSSSHSDAGRRRAAVSYVLRSGGRLWATARTNLPWVVGVAFLLRTRFDRSRTHLPVPQQRTITSASAGKWAASDDPWRRAAALAILSTKPTGPTAWEPPLYPFLIGGVFKLFGVYSTASALVLLTLNSVASALTSVPIFLIAKRSFGERVAVWSSWAWALLPPVMYWCTRWVWETSLAALLLAVLFWLTLEFEEMEGIRALGAIRSAVGRRRA